VGSPVARLVALPVGEVEREMEARWNWSDKRIQLQE